jgi:hypothetical protein
MSKAVFTHEKLGPSHVLAPVDEEGCELLEALPTGKQVMVDVHAARNPKHHRLLFALFRMLMDGGAWEGDKDELLDRCKYAVGLVDWKIDHKGKSWPVPRSIAFESMDQVSFNKFFDRVCYYVAQNLLGGEDWIALRDEIVNAVEGHYK